MNYMEILFISSILTPLNWSSLTKNLYQNHVDKPIGSVNKTCLSVLILNQFQHSLSRLK